MRIPRFGLTFKRFAIFVMSLSSLSFSTTRKIRFPIFWGKQGQLNVIFILIAIANYKRFRIGIYCNNCMQFWLRTSFKSNIEFFTMTHNLLHNRPHLIYLYRIDNRVLSLVSVFFGCRFEAVGNIYYPVVKYIREPHQNRC